MAFLQELLLDLSAAEYDDTFDLADMFTPWCFTNIACVDKISQ